MNSTADYYNSHSKAYFEATVNADVTDLYAHFLKYIDKNSLILDAGCGSGRDSKAFLNMGYKVHAIDASKEMCVLAGEYTGLNVRCIEFLSLDEIHTYDAIWACASMLHVSFERLQQVLVVFRNALLSNGVIYMSFKYGNYEGERDGRFYLDMDELKFKRVMLGISGLEVLESWVSEDSIRGKELSWFNVILRKTKT